MVEATPRPRLSLPFPGLLVFPQDRPPPARSPTPRTSRSVPPLPLYSSQFQVQGGRLIKWRDGFHFETLVTPLTPVSPDSLL
jgi:hypothetical protein